MTQTIVAKAAGIATRKYQCSCHQGTGMIGLLEYGITKPQCEGRQLQRSLSNSFEIETFAPLVLPCGCLEETSQGS